MLFHKQFLLKNQRCIGVFFLHKDTSLFLYLNGITVSQQVFHHSQLQPNNQNSFRTKKNLRYSWEKWLNANLWLDEWHSTDQELRGNIIWPSGMHYIPPAFWKMNQRPSGTATCKTYKYRRWSGFRTRTGSDGKYLFTLLQQQTFACRSVPWWRQCRFPTNEYQWFDRWTGCCITSVRLGSFIAEMVFYSPVQYLSGPLGRRDRLSEIPGMFCSRYTVGHFLFFSQWIEKNWSLSVVPCSSTTRERMCKHEVQEEGRKRQSVNKCNISLDCTWYRNERTCIRDILVAPSNI